MKLTNREKLDILYKRRTELFAIAHAANNDPALLAKAGTAHCHWIDADVDVLNGKDIFMNNYLPELPWIEKAREYIGTKEIVGAKHNPVVLALWEKAFAATGQKNWIKDDETPWCGGFVGGVFAECGLEKHIPKLFPRAREWANVGTKLSEPAYGCVVVFSREGGGHVGFCVGVDKNNNLLILGGNQGNTVCIKPFTRRRVIAYRWCGTMPNPNEGRYDMVVTNSAEAESTNEA